MKAEIEYKGENFKKLYPEGKERNDYISKLQKDYLNLSSQERSIMDKYALIERRGSKGITHYYCLNRVFKHRNDAMLKIYEKERDDLVEPIRSKRHEQAKIMNDINSIYVNMGYCTSKVPFFRTY